MKDRKPQQGWTKESTYGLIACIVIGVIIFIIIKFIASQLDKVL